ncbi:MAG: aminotransferase class V-fold PLP-dependent enzyme [Acidobacteriota bacterium]
MSPTFGRAMLAHWAFDPAVTYLNHGTVGAPPRRVVEAQRAIQDEIERQPAAKLLRELTTVRVGRPTGQTPRLRVVAEEVANFFGARGEDLVFVDNATTGANAVLRALALEEGDEVLVTDHGYGGVTNAARFYTRERGAKLRVVELPDPIRSPEQVVESIAAALRENTSRIRLVLIDHICSDSAILFPVREVAELCHTLGVPVLVDGAHAPGAIDLDIPALGADWYVGNLHKWLWTPRSSGVLWVDPRHQATLHPTVISWGLDEGIATEFDLVGTRDPSPYLAAPAALAMRRELGGEEVIQTYNHELVCDAAERLAASWGVPFPTPRSMFGPMATVLLPESLGSLKDDAARLRDVLLFEHGLELNLGARHGRLRVRIAAQVYNEMADFERLDRAVTSLL